MRPWLVLVLAGLFLQALAMPSRAATTALASIPSAGDCAIGPLTSSIAAVALGANAGSVDLVTTYPCRPIPATDAGPFIWTMNIDGPQLLAGGLAGTSIAIAKTYTGCAVSGADSAVSDFTLTADHYAIASAFTFNSGSSVCSIYLAVTITIATTANTHFRVILTIARETNYRLEYICDHSATTPLAFVPNSNSCGTLNENDAITGSLALSGSLGVVNSGTLHLVVDSWPSLVAAVTNSGTLNVVNSGGQSMAVSGSLTVAGGLTVTNAGGQSLVVTSWPQLQAVLSGMVTSCSSAALAADPKACTSNTTPGNVTVGNNTNIVTVPDHQTLCGPGSTPPYNATTCKPLVANAAVSFPGGVDAPNLPWLGMLVFLSILVAVFWYMGMAFALGWSVAAFIVHILPGLPFSLPVALLLIVIGVTVQYLNERRGERSQAPEDRDTQGVV